ncbi:MAG: hypothetical protein ACPG3W_03380 [Synechococcus sp.]|uniref:hypothetical protein n=1 Tax=Synechococcus sp. BMK-MC-1 TaxID=1442551 RepID=UPI00164686B9|nr:hypothetical protein [Synechococcus sp. BMK-MC-1]QNI68061.1 hypothetical protein SynBMKMC1_01990 [Synechococcus sp. BMK-MC-1]
MSRLPGFGPQWPLADSLGPAGLWCHSRLSGLLQGLVADLIGLAASPGFLPRASL